MGKFIEENKIAIISVTLILVAVFIFLGKEDVWQGVYYPEGVGFGIDESEWEYSPVFKAKESCLAWGEAKTSRNPGSEFECGKNCETEEYGIMVCEQTCDLGGCRN